MPVQVCNPLRHLPTPLGSWIIRSPNRARQMTTPVGWMTTRFISDFALCTHIPLAVGTRTRRWQGCAGKNRKASRLGGSCLRNGSACLSRDPPNHLSLPKTEELNQKNNDQGDQDGIDGWHHHAILIGLSRAIPPTARCAFIPHFGIFVKSHFPPTMKMLPPRFATARQRLRSDLTERGE